MIHAKLLDFLYFHGIFRYFRMPSLGFGRRKPARFPLPRIFRHFRTQALTLVHAKLPDSCIFLGFAGIGASSGLQITQSCQISCIFQGFASSSGCKLWELNHAKLPDFLYFPRISGILSGSCLCASIGQSSRTCHENRMLSVMLPIISVILANIILETS